MHRDTQMRWKGSFVSGKSPIDWVARPCRICVLIVVLLVSSVTVILPSLLCLSVLQPGADAGKDLRQWSVWTRLWPHLGALQHRQPPAAVGAATARVQTQGTQKHTLFLLCLLYMWRWYFMHIVFVAISWPTVFLLLSYHSDTTVYKGTFQRLLLIRVWI